MRPCRNCRQAIGNADQSCPHCGDEQDSAIPLRPTSGVEPETGPRRWWLFVLCLPAIATAVGYAIGGESIATWAGTIAVVCLLIPAIFWMFAQILDAIGG